MKTNKMFAASLCALLIAGCSKTSTPKSAENAIVTNTITSSSNSINQIANETSEVQRLKLLLQSMTSTTATSDVESIIDLHTQKKLSDFEFRGLFWNVQISKELINISKENLGNDQQLTNLDKILIQSIAEENVSFNDLLIEIKKDITTIPSSMQSILIEELTKLYLNDFDSINNDQVTIFEKLSVEKDSTQYSLLESARKILELEFYKKRLNNKKLVTNKNTTPFIYREIKTNFNLNYSFNIGRCGNRNDNVSNFSKINISPGLNCPTQTPSTVEFRVYTDVTNDGGATSIEALVYTATQGGYDKNHSEDATTILGYTLSGTIVIPKCSNPAFCNQLITIMPNDTHMSFGTAPATNQGISVSVNGTGVPLILQNEITIDISKNDAVINIIFTGSDKRVGAFDVKPPSQQKLRLWIAPSSNVMHSVSPEDKFFMSTFQDPESEVFPFTFFNETNLNTPSLQVSVLKTMIAEAIKNKETLDSYRSLFYDELETDQMGIDQLMATNGDPSKILYYRQKQSSVSDVIGRQMILPIINSKLLAYQNSSTLNMQVNINEMLKSILIKNLNAESTKQEILTLVKSRMNNLDSESAALASNFLNTLKKDQLDQKTLLNQIGSFQSDFIFLTKKMKVEMELLSLEQAQFSEVTR